MSTLPALIRSTLVTLCMGICLCLLLAAPASAQNDLSTTAITQPVSGCALTATESVTIRLFNYGNTLPAATSFNVSYTINGGGPVTELVTLGSTLVSNTALTYTFTTQANLSTPGTYTLDATVSLAGDIAPANNALTGRQVENSAPSIGGTLSGPGSGSSGALTLTGNTGAVVQWEQSPDTLRWIKLANTTNSQSFSGLTTPTQFRARVVNGRCPDAVSNVVMVVP